MEHDYDTARLLAWRRWTDLPLLIIAIGGLPLLVLELAANDLADIDQAFLYALNLLVAVAFGVDYIVELSLVEKKRSYARHEWPSLLIVFTQGLALLPSLSSLGLLRILRGARAGRALIVLLRILAIGGAAARDGRQILRRHAASFALGMAAMTWLCSAVAFTLAEDVGEHGRIHSFFDALWWSTTTITTVGYGDVFPITGVGRIIGAITMGVGISAFAVITAKVAEFLVRAGSEDQAGTTG